MVGFTLPKIDRLGKQRLTTTFAKIKEQSAVKEGVTLLCKDKHKKVKSRRNPHLYEDSVDCYIQCSVDCRLIVMSFTIVVMILRDV
jgi:hypothetical protein